MIFDTFALLVHATSRPTKAASSRRTPNGFSGSQTVHTFRPEKNHFMWYI
jgi:hypothetical protein